ncbi:hypothetical protein BpHYR1_024374 [Brachionus plicatilis]|uniref:Uncharacterized protein n=1 Tax=Brachionus plicatilis TaxID=10195 RepID=A0A3M7R286_BRAPC|nr:hypothetical protein BpHYR1_024374 [Brachionus plicatilis]
MNIMNLHKGSEDIKEDFQIKPPRTAVREKTFYQQDTQKCWCNYSLSLFEKSLDKDWFSCGLRT